MIRSHARSRTALCLAVGFAGLLACLGQSADTGRPAAATAPAGPPASQPAGGAAGKLPHVSVDRTGGTVDIEASVCTRKAEWLELLVCTPNTKEYESILVTRARPSHIHLGLLMLGATPGSPLKVEWVGEQSRIIPPKGPRVGVTLIYEKDGRRIEADAAQWLIDQRTGKPLPKCEFLFTGSRFEDLEGNRVFAADAEGTVLSLVSFGEDLLALPGEETNYSGEFPFAPNTQLIPAEGTSVTVRLKLLQTPPGTQPAR